MTGVPQPIRDLVERTADAWRAALGERLRSVVLFGSWARGEATDRSDVDLAVVVDPPSEGDWSRLCRPIGRDPEERPDVSIVLWSGAQLAAHPWLMIDVATDGIIVLDDGRLRREMDDVRERLRRYGSVREYLPDGTWFWDLKPDWKPGDVIEI
ncbi:MAG: nucleotidyltransferase domain-containing protein [Myxococcota bacterium]